MTNIRYFKSFRDLPEVLAVSRRGHQGPCRHEHNQFGPWHLADRVTLPDATGPLDTGAHDAFAIRYRVIRRDFPRRKM